MERMTRRLVSGAADYDYPKDCFYNDGTSDRIAQSAFRQNAIERLAAYEDTGLTPERCAEFARADAEGRYIVMRDAEQEGVARLRALAEADKAGRVVVLPCKVGDTVWLTRTWVSERLSQPETAALTGAYICGHGACTFVTDKYGFQQNKIGKDVFFTCEEAEQAMEDRKEGV